MDLYVGRGGMYMTCLWTANVRTGMTRKHRLAQCAGLEVHRVHCNCSKEGKRVAVQWAALHCGQFSWTPMSNQRLKLEVGNWKNC